MKFLVDAQLPPKMCEILNNAGFEARHVEALPEGDETPDREIAVYADGHNLMVITKDSDFYFSHMLLHQPQKLFLITTGNIKNRDLFDLIRKHINVIKELVHTCSYIEMSNDGIFGH